MWLKTPTTTTLPKQFIMQANTKEDPIILQPNKSVLVPILK